MIFWCHYKANPLMTFSHCLKLIDQPFLCGGRLASKVRGARLVDHFYDKSNWCIILEKL